MDFSLTRTQDSRPIKFRQSSCGSTKSTICTACLTLARPRGGARGMCRFGGALPHVHFGSPISSFLFRPIRHITRGRRCTQTVRVLLLSVRPSSDNALGVLSSSHDSDQIGDRTPLPTHLGLAAGARTNLGLVAGSPKCVCVRRRRILNCHCHES